MHVLIKFTKLDYAKSFQQGKLYMNTLSWFWNNGFEDQKDILEGVIAKIQPRNMSAFDPTFLNVQCEDFQIQACGYEFCNVFCMSKIDVNVSPNGQIRVTAPAKMDKFGEYAVIIDDEEEFLKRINRAITNNGHKYLCGKIMYHSPKINGKNMTANHQMLLKTANSYDIKQLIRDANHRKYDSFDKSTEYQYQNEWRLTLYRGVREQDAYLLDIGDLNDITHIVKNSEINIIQLINEHKNLSKSVDCYYGNVDRHELRDLFYQLGENKGWLYSTIG